MCGRNCRQPATPPATDSDTDSEVHHVRFGHRRRSKDAHREAVGRLRQLQWHELGGFAIAAALERAGVAPDQVDYVFMGQVILAGQGQITARQAAVKGGMPMTVPATTVNKVCLSGLNTIYLADQMINAGDADIVVAGGMESMTQAPHLLPGARAGFRLGDATLVDSMMFDGLTYAFDQCAMGLSYRALQPEGRGSPGSARTPFRPVPREGCRGDQGRALRRRDRAGAGSPAQGRPPA